MDRPATEQPWDTPTLTSPEFRSEIVDRARALAPRIAGLAADIERERRLPRELLDALHEAQLFRLLLPRSQGGLETDSVTFFHVIETIAAADASVAWCLAQAGGCATAAAYLDPAVAREVFGESRAVVAWGPGPKARAVAVEQVNGKQVRERSVILTSASYQTYAHARAIAITITAVIKLSSAQVLAELWPSLSCIVMGDDLPSGCQPHS